MISQTLRAMQSSYGLPDITGSRPQHHQHFPPPSLSPNFPIPNTQQVHNLQHQFRFVTNQQQQQQQPSGMMVDPLSKFNFGHRNGLLGGDHQSLNFDAAAVPNHSPLWRYDQNGLEEPQFEKFPEEPGFANPNYRPLGSEIHPQIQFPNVLDGELKMEEEEESKKLDRQFERMARALEGRILAHQERLCQRFMERIDRLEKARIQREESWRAAEAERARLRAAARAQELAVASSREAVIVSYLERITGEKIVLPNASSSSPPPPPAGGRWPKPEVEALVRVRSEMDAKFRGQEHKAALWEEVSGAMGRMGHQRSAKSCKDKWENINKYYSATKSKDEGDEEKKRAPKRRMTTCSYFDQLDQLYSKQDAAAAAQPSQAIETDTDSKTTTNNVNDSSCSQIENSGNVESKVDGGEEHNKDGVDSELLLEAMLDAKSNADPSESVEGDQGWNSDMLI